MARRIRARLSPQVLREWRGKRFSVRRVAHRCEINEDQPTPTFNRIINPTDWEGAPIPPQEWIVPDYIPHKTVTLLSGDGATGKSLLGLQIAVARALAREWIGLLPEPGRTLILSAEDDADEMHRRLDDIRKFYDARMADLSDIRLVDLVGEDSVLGYLMKGQIEPTAVYRALDSYMTEFNTEPDDSRRARRYVFRR